MRLVRLVCGALLALAAVASSAQAKPPPPDYSKHAEELIQAFADSGLFSGAVLVANDGKPVFRKGFGFADREWDAATTPETLFRLGSITKQFTATAILQLVEQGKLGLDDKVSKYYAAAPPAWSEITVRHLLTHSSGIPSYTNQPAFFRDQSMTARTPEQIIALTRDMPLEFTPGSRFAYDNSGYILLGYIVERVSGETYANYVQRHILTPLGMAHTGYDVSTLILPKRAAGYMVEGGVARNAPYLAMSLPYAAGSLYSNVDDLLAWDQALHAGKVLKPASVTAMFTDAGHGYGFGQLIENQKGHRLWTHGGGINGFATTLSRYPDDGLTIVVLSNVQQAATGRIAAQLADLYLGAPPPPVVAVKPEVLDRHVGAYQFGPRAVLRVARQDDHLTVQLTGQQPVAFYPVAGDRFAARIVEASISFDPNSQVATLHQGGADRPAQRIDAAEAARLESQPRTPPPVEVKIDPAVLDRYVGTYRLTPNLDLTVTREGDKLFVQGTRQARFEAFPSSERDFFLKIGAIALTFNGSATAKATEVVLHQGGVDTVGKRTD